MLFTVPLHRDQCICNTLRTEHVCEFMRNKASSERQRPHDTVYLQYLGTIAYHADGVWLLILRVIITLMSEKLWKLCI